MKTTDQILLTARYALCSDSPLSERQLAARARVERALNGVRAELRESAYHRDLERALATKRARKDATELEMALRALARAR